MSSSLWSIITKPDNALRLTAAGELGPYSVLFRILIFGIAYEILAYQFLKGGKNEFKRKRLQIY
jgi:hypothetical protein